MSQPNEYKKHDVLFQSLFEPGEIKPGQNYSIIEADPARNFYKIKGAADGDIRLMTRQNLDTYFRRGRSSFYRGR